MLKVLREIKTGWSWLPELDPQNYRVRQKDLVWIMDLIISEMRQEYKDSLEWKCYCRAAIRANRSLDLATMGIDEDWQLHHEYLRDTYKAALKIRKEIT